MKVTLLRDVKGVGKKYEEKNVSDGYAINFLLPKKLALAASGPGAKQIEELKRQDTEHKAREDQKHQESLSKIAGKTISIKMKANEAGHLFASLNAEKLSKLLKSEQGIEIESSHIVLPTQIKEIGTYEVPISIKQGIETKFTLELLRS